VSDEQRSERGWIGAGRPVYFPADTYHRVARRRLQLRPLPRAKRRLAYYEVATMTWVVEPTDYLVEVGSSSEDLPLSATLTVAP